MSLITRTRIVAGKIETTPGTAETLANADASFYAYESDISNSLSFTQRSAAGSLSQVSAQPGVESGTHNFKVDMYQSAPWSSILMPAAGFVVAAGESWSPSDDSTDWEALTTGHNISGKLKRLAGGMVQSLTFNFKAGEPTVVDASLLGRYVPESDAATLTPTFAAGTESAATKLESATFTIGGTTTCFATATLSIQNTVSLILCATKTGGIDRAWIEQRLITLVVDPLEQLVATRDDHGIQRGRTEQAVVLSYGNISATLPAAQLTQIGNGERNGLSARALTFQANMDATAGDELVLDFDTTL